MIPASYLRAKHSLYRLLNTSAPALFMREWLAKPATVGAVWPSSRQLARQMAAQVPITDGSGIVVELGAGTGTVTHALLERGIPPDRLVVVERSPAFVRHLRVRFPHITVVLGDATHLTTLLPSDVPIAAIVSGLPLRSLPAANVKAIVSQWRRLLAPGGLVVQFTYDLRHRLGRTMRGFAVHGSRIVWVNLPPARVLTLAPRRKTNGG